MRRTFTLEIVEQDGSVSKVYGTLPASPVPAAPTALTLDEVSGGYVSLSWIDDGSGTSWTVYRGGSPLTTTSSTAYTDSTVAPSTAYSYQVQASNSSGSSALSDALAVTTSANSAPEWDLIDQSGILGQAYSLNLATVCSDADAHTLSFSITAGSVPGVSLLGNNLTGTPTTAGANSLTLSASDGYTATPVTITFTVSDPDVTAPSVPTNVVASVNGSTITLTWTDSTDATGVATYRVYRGGVFRSLSTFSPYIETGVPVGTYTYSVSAVDSSANANESAQGSAAPVSVTPQTPDVPINFTASAASATQINLSWAAGPNGSAPDDYDLDFSTVGTSGPWTPITFVGTATTYSHTGRTQGTTYYYRVRAGLGATESGYAATSLNFGGAADFIIPSNVSSWNAAASQPRVSGGTAIPNSISGAVIELSGGTSTTVATSGTRGTLTISNLRGTAAVPMTVRVAPGTLVTNNSTASFRWNINNCQYVTFDGATTNASASVPILHATAPYRCGIKMTGTGNCTAWIKFGITTHLPKGITIQYVEIAGNNTQGSCVHYQDDTGNRINTFPNQYREDFTLRYCYFHNAGGLYHGGNYEADETGGLETPCRRSTIEYNRIVNSTEENIGMKMHWEGPNYIRYNWLEGAGRDTAGAAIDQRNAVSVQCSTCYVYGNFIVNAGQGSAAQGVGLGPNGISLLSSNGPDVTGVPSAGAGVPAGDFDEYGPFPYFLVEIYNNVIVDSAWHGITSKLGTLNASKGPGVVNLVPQLLKIYNNTICTNGASGSGYDGINVAASNAVYAGSFIRNNILIGNDGSALAGYATTLGGSNNKTTGDTVASLFEDPTAALYVNRDYHLVKAVPVAAGSTLGTNVSTTDLDGDARSLATADQGAYEYP